MKRESANPLDRLQPTHIPGMLIRSRITCDKQSSNGPYTCSEESESLSVTLSRKRDGLAYCSAF